MEKSGDSLIFNCFFGFFRPRILENYPRQSSAFFWTGLELWGPQFDRFRPTFPVVQLVDPKKYENPTFSFYFQKNRPCVDLAICYTEKKKQLCTTKSDRLGDKTSFGFPIIRGSRVSEQLRGITIFHPSPGARAG